MDGEGEVVARGEVSREAEGEERSVEGVEGNCVDMRGYRGECGGKIRVEEWI